MKSCRKVEVALFISTLPDVPNTEEGSGKGKAPKAGTAEILAWAYGEESYDCHPDGWGAT